MRLCASARRLVLGLSLAVGAGCSTAGSTWMAEPLSANDEPLLGSSAAPESLDAPTPPRRPARTHVLGEEPRPD
jgi:hypothetical protein